MWTSLNCVFASLIFGYVFFLKFSMEKFSRLLCVICSWNVIELLYQTVRTWDCPKLHKLIISLILNECRPTCWSQNCADKMMRLFVQLPHYLNGSTKGLSNWMNFAGRLLNWTPLQCLVSITVSEKQFLCCQCRPALCDVNPQHRDFCWSLFVLVALLEIWSSSISVCPVLRFKWLVQHFRSDSLRVWSWRSATFHIRESKKAVFACLAIDIRQNTLTVLFANCTSTKSSCRFYIRRSLKLIVDEPPLIISFPQSVLNVHVWWILYDRILFAVPKDSTSNFGDRDPTTFVLEAFWRRETEAGGARSREQSMLQKVIHTLEKIDRFDICVDLQLYANGNLSCTSCRSLLLL